MIFVKNRIPWKKLKYLHLKTRDGKIFYLAHRILMGSQKKDALWRNQENKIITWTQAQKLKSAFDSGLYYIVSSYIRSVISLIYLRDEHRARAISC